MRRNRMRGDRLGGVDRLGGGLRYCCPSRHIGHHDPGPVDVDWLPLHVAVCADIHNVVIRLSNRAGDRRHQ
jgi:hypothetical protein